jgi:sporulation protein YlmC with PRC-barrel domain
MSPVIVTRVAIVAFSTIAFLGGAIAQQGGSGSSSQGSGSSSQGAGSGSQGSGSGSQGSGSSSQGGSSSSDQQQGGSGGSSGSSGGSSGSSGGSSGSSAGQSGAQKDAPVAGKIPLGVTVAEEALIAKGWRASKLTRADVYNDKNEKIGRVEDVIVAPDGKLSIAVVDVGGFLGLKRHRVAIPVQQFTQINPPKVVLPGATKDALKQLPEFQFATA